MRRGFIIGVLFFLSIVVALNFNTFDDLLTEENITFAGDENISRNLTVYRYANFTSAFMNLSGYITNYLNAPVFGDLRRAYPTIFEMNDETFMITGYGLSTAVFGYKWNGSAWEVNDTIKGGISYPGTARGSPHYFEFNNTNLLIAGGGTAGGIRAFQWDGTIWVENSTWVSGVSNAGEYMVPTTFQIDGDLYLVVSSQENTTGVGYKWNGSGWDANSTIGSGLTGINQANAFYYKEELFLISATGGGLFVGYKWNGSGWDANSTIITGLSWSGTRPSYRTSEYKDEVYQFYAFLSMGNLILRDWEWVSSTSFNNRFPTSPNISINGTSIWSLFGSTFNGTTANLFQLNDSSTEKEITFTGDENKTEFLKILKHASITIGFIDVFNLSGLTNPTLIINGTTVWSGIGGTSTLNDSLISYYKLDESSGAVLDETGDNDGTNVGATPNVAGKINTAYDFERDNTDYITFGDKFDFLYNEAFAISAWIKRESLGNTQVIFSKKDRQSPYRGYFLAINNDNKIWFEYVGDSGILALTTDDAVVATTGIWYHVVLTYDNEVVKVYVNGSEKAFTKSSDTLSAGVDSGFSANIGGIEDASGGNDMLFDGIIDEVIIWDRSLLDSEVVALYNSDSPPSFPFLPSSTNITDDLSTPINNFLSGCSPDSENYCDVPLEFHSDTAGIIKVSNINISYNNISKTLNFFQTLNNALSSGSCDGGILDGVNCIIEFLFHSDTAGILQYSDINLTYDSIPHATQESPDNDIFSLVGQGQDFNCSSLDATNLSNITIQIFYPNGTSFDNQSVDISGTSNSSNFTITFNETGDHIWNCLVVNNESFSFTSTNRTIKVRELTLSPQTWTFASPRLNEETKWSNSLTVTNPIDLNVTAELNITTDTLAIPSSIVVKNSSGTILSHTFNTTDGQVRFNGFVFSGGNNFNIVYNTSNITLSQVLFNETVGGNIFRVINFTITANTTRTILEVDSVLDFDDTATVDITFKKCTAGVCTEDITNRSDVVFTDNDFDGTSDRVNWFVLSLSNQSYQLRRLFGFPIQISQNIEILNEPVRPFDNVDWRNTITFFNPNSFESESVLKVELPFGSRDIELDDIPKNLQFDPFGTIAPYILIIDKDDPTHKETLFLLPGQTKTIVMEYITDSVTILPEIFQPSFFKVGERAEINQILRIKNQADDTVTDIEHNIPISSAEDLRACEGEFENGCPEEGDSDEDLIFDEQSRVNGNYKLTIDSINASEVKHITLSYFIDTVKIINTQSGRSSVVGFNDQLSFIRYTYESIAPIKLLDVRHNTAIDGDKVISARLCDSNNVCETELEVVEGTIHLGVFDSSDRKVVEFWFTEEAPEPKGMGFIGWFLEFGREFDISNPPLRQIFGWAGTEVNGKVVITTGRIIAIVLGAILLILIAIFIILFLIRRRK